MEHGLYKSIKPGFKSSRSEEWSMVWVKVLNLGSNPVGLKNGAWFEKGGPNTEIIPVSPFCFRNSTT